MSYKKTDDGNDYMKERWETIKDTLTIDDVPYKVQQQIIQQFTRLAKQMDVVPDIMQYELVANFNNEILKMEEFTKTTIEDYSKNHSELAKDIEHIAVEPVIKIYLKKT